MGNNTPSNAMTLEKLMEAAAKLRAVMPKPATFLVSKHYDPEQNIKIEGKDEIFVLLHPITLERVLAETRKAKVSDANLGNPLFAGVPIFEMDSREDDTPERTAAIGVLTARLSAALNQAVAIFAERQRKEDMRGGDYESIGMPIRKGPIISNIS